MYTEAAKRRIRHIILLYCIHVSAAQPPSVHFDKKRFKALVDFDDDSSQHSSELESLLGSSFDGYPVEIIYDELEDSITVYDNEYKRIRYYIDS